MKFRASRCCEENKRQICPVQDLKGYHKNDNDNDNNDNNNNNNLHFLSAKIIKNILKGHKRGNTRNIEFQLAMQQCCETS